MLFVLISLIAMFSIGLNFWMMLAPSKTVPSTNNNLRQLLRNGMILTDAMLKARHAEEYIMKQTHEALNAWEDELLTAIAQFNDEEEEPC